MLHEVLMVLGITDKAQQRAFISLYFMAGCFNIEFELENKTLPINDNQFRSILDQVDILFAGKTNDKILVHIEDFGKNEIAKMRSKHMGPDEIIIPEYIGPDRVFVLHEYLYQLGMITDLTPETNLNNCDVIFTPGVNNTDVMGYELRYRMALAMELLFQSVLLKNESLRQVSSAAITAITGPDR